MFSSVYNIYYFIYFYIFIPRNKKLHSLYRSPNIVTMIKIDRLRLRLADYIARMEVVGVA